MSRLKVPDFIPVPPLPYATSCRAEGQFYFHFTFSKMALCLKWVTTCVRVSRLKSQTRARLVWNFPGVSPVSPNKCQYATSDYNTFASFHILSNSPITKQCDTRSCVACAANNAFQKYVNFSAKYSEYFIFGISPPDTVYSDSLGHVRVHSKNVCYLSHVCLSVRM
jgi:hypothetical protein